MNVLGAIAKRVSVRNYKTAQISDEILGKILKAAIYNYILEINGKLKNDEVYMRLLEKNHKKGWCL